MKRSGPLQRKTPMKRSGPIQVTAPKPRSTLPRQPMKRRPKFESLEYRELRIKIKLRDGGCVAPGLVPDVQCWGRQEVHHLWRRSQKGPDAEWNLKTLCAAHHEWVHSHVKEARRLDLLRRPGQTGPAV